MPPDEATDETRTTRIFTHDDCLKHRPPGGFPERVERLRSLHHHFATSGIDVVRPEIDEEAVDRAVRAVHDERYVHRLRAAAERGDGVIDSADNPLSKGTWDAVVAAVSTALAAADWVYGTDPVGPRHAFVATRPPGHHATASKAMGFCYFNHVAAAAQHLLGRAGIERVAVLDFDVHHGNGTQDIFWRRGDVFYLSCHQAPFYPGTGRASETGAGDGKGATLNVPMAAGKGDEDYLRVFDQQLLPALRDWAPDALMVSAGFDAWQGDPLGGMNVGLEGFRAMGERLGRFADEVCGGRLVSLLEGGYDVSSLPRLVDSYIAGAS